MQYHWKITIDDYLEVVKRALALGLKSGESMEEVFLEYMKEKNQKPLGATELTKEELIKEYQSHGKSILEGITDKNGKTKFKKHYGLDNE